MANTELIKKLQHPSVYPHPIQQFKLLETHISWVILTGEYAYKIKKPVDFGFLNYATLELRRHYCEMEVALNRVLAPELYVEVVAITGSEDAPYINGTGPVLDYAVKMREFSQSNLFPYLLTEGSLTLAVVDELAKVVADFHKHTPIADAKNVYGTPEHVHAPVVQNFEQILPLLTEEHDKQQIQRLATWADHQYHKYQTLLAIRKSQGFIRDCHGDLHFGNIILYDNKPVVFDRIEFNEDLRWTDVMADIAFLVMDLAYRGQPLLANRFLNTYLQHTGDYKGLAILPYYLSYRAVVRAKVSLFELLSIDVNAEERAAVMQRYQRFINLAETYTHAHLPCLFIMHGFSGSGKSTVARGLAEQLGAIHISSDVERKRLFGLTMQEKSHSELNHGIYKTEFNKQVYDELLHLANVAIASGFSVIVDATFLHDAQRTMFYQLAHQANVPFVIISCEAPQAYLQQWIEQRANESNDPSEAGLAVLAQQQKQAKPLNAEEMQRAVVVDTVQFDIQDVVKAVRSFL